ncbi:MAG: hypothetical protein WBG91_21295, partial [Syntrophobacteria bacterium]
PYRLPAEFPRLAQPPVSPYSMLCAPISNLQSKISHPTSPNPFHTYQMATILRLKGNVIICPSRITI